MNTNPLTETQTKILEFISNRGKNNPITSYQLSNQAGIKDKDWKLGSNLRSVINTLRDKGYPICASNEGYYYPQNKEELKQFIESFKNRILQQQLAVNSLEEKLDCWDNINNFEKEDKEKKVFQTPLFNLNRRF